MKLVWFGTGSVPAQTIYVTEEDLSLSLISAIAVDGWLSLEPTLTYDDAWTEANLNRTAPRIDPRFRLFIYNPSFAAPSLYVLNYSFRAGAQITWSPNTNSGIGMLQLHFAAEDDITNIF